MFITGNKINGLALSATPNSPVIFGLGNSFARLADIHWLHARTVCHWGDIDTHGFAILDSQRAVFPNTRLFLMDHATLLSHRPIWVEKPERFDGLLTWLNAPEQALFREIRRGDVADQLRLEQERMSFHWFTEALKILP